MFPDIDEIKRIRKKYNGKMFLSGIKTFKEVAEVEEKALEDGILKQKYKELIALGISISHGCYGWIEYHVNSAVDHGASHKEILEATAVALALSGSMADWYVRFVFKILDELKNPKQKKNQNSKYSANA